MTQRPINDNWRQYFEDFDEGLGTTYERFILHRYFEKIQAMCSIKSVLEVPSFGMTGISGINSIWWSHHGIQVTIVDDNTERIKQIEKIWKTVGFGADLVYQKNDYTSPPFPDKCFDLSWNFAALDSVSDLHKLFAKLTRITRKVIFICIPNDNNLCLLLRSGLCVSGPPQEKSIQIRELPEIMAELGWKVIERGYFDVPPWPDIAMKKEDLLRKLGLSWFAKFLESKKKGDSSILNYFNGKDPDMEKRVLRWSFLEDIPRIFKKLWAHHRYYIFVPR